MSHLKVFLIGMPSCGKSTLAKVLSEKIGLKMLDLDKEIIKIENQPLTKDESEFYDYVSALPNDGAVIINCIICRVSAVKLKAAMAGENIIMRLW